MTPTILLSLLGAIALGILMILWGKRGKRLNKNPTCRDCRFDLSGVYPDGVTCPECGGGLNRRKAVRMGARRKRWIPIALGVLLVLLPGTTVALATFAALTGQDINDYKPVGLLIWESQNAGEELVIAAGEQLLERYEIGKLTGEQTERVVQAALLLQGNLARPWHTSWGDIIENERIAGSMTDEDVERYLSQAAVIEVSARPRVRVGDAIPVMLELADTRVGEDTACIVFVAVNGCRLNAESVDLGVEPAHAGWSPTTPSASFWIMGSSSPWMTPGLGKQMQVFMLDGLRTSGTGPQRVELDLRVKVAQQDQNAMGWSWPQAEEEWEDAEITTHGVAVEALDASTELVKAVTPTDEQRTSCRAELEPTEIYVHDAGFGGPAVQMKFSVSGLPMDIAFKVTFEQGERSWAAGSLVSKPAAASDDHYYYSPWRGDSERIVMANVRGLKKEPLTVRLTPDTDMALRSIDVERIYAEEIVIKDVQLDWQMLQQTPSTPNPILSFLRAIIGG